MSPELRLWLRTEIESPLFDSATQWLLLVYSRHPRLPDPVCSYDPQDDTCVFLWERDGDWVELEVNEDKQVMWWAGDASQMPVTPYERWADDIDENGHSWLRRIAEPLEWVH